VTGASHSIDVRVTPEQFLAVIDDYPRYPEFQPDVKSIRVEEREPGRVRVAYEFDARFMGIAYALDHFRVSPLRIEWRLVRGEKLKQNAGSWTLEPLARGGTRVTYAIELIFAARIPEALPKALAEHGLPRMLGNFKARAESLFGRAAEL
jgi:ribosome-associated toxin RatA of RatAB toxin-antitoxin module